jgi:hypothetical protein
VQGAPGNRRSYCETALTPLPFEQLKSESPPGLRYASFKLDDGVSFVHIASIETSDGSNPLGERSAFKAFIAEIKDRCEEPPNAMELTEVGSYRLFGD